MSETKQIAVRRAELPSTRSSGRQWRPELPNSVALIWLLPVVALLGVVFFVPLIRVVHLSLATPSLSLTRYRSFFDNPAQVKALLTTLKISGIVTVITLSLGATVAWALRTTRSRILRTLLWIGTIFPLWMSVVVLTYVFTILLQRYGIVNKTLQGVGLTHRPLGLLYNDGAVAVAMTYSLLPFAILPLYGTFVNIDEDLIRAAESLGASRPRAVLGIVLPLSLPSILASGAIVFVIALGFYITPTLLGTPTQPFLAGTIADQVYNQFDVAGASAASSLLLLIAFAVIASVVVLVGGQRLRRAIA